jgi:hypothetical protein
MSRTWIYMLAVLAIATVLCAGTAMAQIPDDVYFVNYFSNASHNGGLDASVRIDNPGVDNGKNLCADIYVFDAVEEQVECCGCPLTPDDLRTISVNNGLTDQPSSNVKPTNGVIKIVSALPNVGGTGCDPTGGASLLGGFKNNIVPTPDVRAWATHIQVAPAGTTESAFADSTLTQTELNGLQETCFQLRQLGSGRGVCTCGFGL